MENSSARFSCRQAKELDMVGYLAGLGIQPVKIKGPDFWYYSPFRDERTPSFKINRTLNCWYDFGEGAGGDLIDFAVRYHDCTVGELLRILSGEVVSHKLFLKPPAPSGSVRENSIVIRQVRPIYYAALYHYLTERRIPVFIADRYCKQVHYTTGGKTYFAIGFPNNSGGFELRSQYFKGSSSPKDLTTIENGSNRICVFEGFFDLLSYLTVFPTGATAPADFLVLNSLAHFEKARPTLDRYGKIRLFLDNDRAGEDCTRYALSLGEQFTDESELYKNHKDLNDFLCQLGKTGKNAGERPLLPP